MSYKKNSQSRYLIANFAAFESSESNSYEKIEFLIPTRYFLVMVTCLLNLKEKNKSFLNLVDISSSKSIASIALVPKTKKCVFSFYDTFIVMCVNNHQLTFIEVTNGRILYTFELTNFSVDKLAVYRGPNKEFYLILTKLDDFECGIYVYDVINANFIKTFTGHKKSIEEVYVIESQIEDAAGSSPNIIILSRSKDNTCRTWSIPLSSSNNLFSYPTPITSALLTPNGYLINGTSDGTVYCWFESTKNFIRSYPGHTTSVVSLCMYCKYNLQIIIAGAADGSIRLWDHMSEKCVATFLGHTAAVNYLCVDKAKSRFKRDFLFSCSVDGLIKKWDLYKFVSDFFTKNLLCIPYSFGWRNQRESYCCENNLSTYVRKLGDEDLVSEKLFTNLPPSLRKVDLHSDYEYVPHDTHPPVITPEGGGEGEGEGAEEPTFESHLPQDESCSETSPFNSPINLTGPVRYNRINPDKTSHKSPNNISSKLSNSSKSSKVSPAKPTSVSSNSNSNSNTINTGNLSPKVAPYNVKNTSKQGSKNETNKNFSPWFNVSVNNDTDSTSNNDPNSNAINKIDPLSSSSQVINEVSKMNLNLKTRAEEIKSKVSDLKVSESLLNKKIAEISSNIQNHDLYDLSDEDNEDKEIEEIINSNSNNNTKKSEVGRKSSSSETSKKKQVLNSEKSKEKVADSLYDLSDED